MLRFRPIMMTTMAALLGALPLALGLGDGAELRRPLGIAIVGGLMFSQLLTLYTTPVVYLYLDRFRLWCQRRWRPAPRAGTCTGRRDETRGRPSSCSSPPWRSAPAARSGPDYVRPRAPARRPTRKWRAGSGASRATCCPRQWWRVFGDPVLDALEAQVDVSNQNSRPPRRSIARRWRSAAARAGLFPDARRPARRRRAARRLRSPTQPSFATGPVNNYNAILECELGARPVGQRPPLGRGGEAAWQASAAQTRGGAAVGLRVARAELFSAARHRRAATDPRGHGGGLRAPLELTQNRYAAGVAAKVDVIQAQVQLQEHPGAGVDLGVTRAQLEHAIAMLIGEPAPTFSVAPGTARRDAAASSRSACRPSCSSAVRTSPRPSARVAAANAQIGVAQAALYPTLTLSGAAGFRSTSYGRLVHARRAGSGRSGPRSRKRSSTAGCARAETDQAIAAYDADVATYRQTVLTGFQQVEDNLAALRILEEEAGVQGEAVRAARQAVELTTQPVQGGDGQLPERDRGADDRAQQREYRREYPRPAPRGERSARDGARRRLGRSRAREHAAFRDVAREGLGVVRERGREPALGLGEVHALRRA